MHILVQVHDMFTDCNKILNSIKRKLCARYQYGLTWQKLCLF